MTIGLNWSTRIAILYLGFVGIIISLMVVCFGHKTELEFKDYYARELRFQEQIAAEKNANALQRPISYEVKGGIVTVQFPEEIASDISGKIEFMRPSDASKDLSVDVRPSATGTQVIADPRFSRGVYKMRISVQSGNTSYFKEAVIAIR